MKAAVLLAEKPAIAKRFLLPGEMAVTIHPTEIKTVLGSCVAIIMRSPRTGVAAIAHCLLPRAGVSAYSLPRQEALKYVDTTTEILLDTFRRRNIAWDELDVKLFGGADSMHPESLEGSHYGVGSANSEAALAALAAQGLAPSACDIGGRRGRVLEFHTGTGEVLLKRLPGIRRHHE